jgi:RNA polymerase sigma-70 factor (ECF subfamily)
MDPDQLTEQLSRCQAGDPAAFSWLLAEYGPRLYRYFYRLAGNESDAEDMLQDLMVKLLEKIKGYSHQGKFDHWLFRVAANLNRDRLRRISRTEKTVSLQMATGENLTIADGLASEEPEPGEILEMGQDVDKLQAALMQLQETDREIIMLRHYSGLSYKEIAEQLDMRLGTALARVHRGLKKLQRIMSKDET